MHICPLRFLLLSSHRITHYRPPAAAVMLSCCRCHAAVTLQDFSRRPGKMAFVQIVHLCFGQTASFGQIGSFQEVGCHFGHVYTCMPDLDDLFFDISNAVTKIMIQI